MICYVCSGEKTKRCRFCRGNGDIIIWFKGDQGFFLSESCFDPDCKNGRTRCGFCRGTGRVSSYEQQHGFEEDFISSSRERSRELRRFIQGRKRRTLAQAKNA